MTWLKGRHTMKGGFDIKWFNWTSPVNFTGADDFGVFRFNNNIQAGGTGHPFANFLLGLPTDVDQTASGPNVDGVATHYGFFAQDEWRVNSRMTLSLGSATSCGRRSRIARRTSATFCARRPKATWSCRPSRRSG